MGFYGTSLLDEQRIKIVELKSLTFQIDNEKYSWFDEEDNNETSENG